MVTDGMINLAGGSKHPINEYVRQRLRRMRALRGMTITDAAKRLGLPRSSYSSFETGISRLSLDHLFEILEVLEADIEEVWPIGNEFGTIKERQGPFKSINRYRLCEIVFLSNAEGAALLRLSKPNRCQILMSTRLSDYFLDRIMLYLEDGIRYKPGIWVESDCGQDILSLYIKTGTLSHELNALVQRYMALWCSVHLDDSRKLSLSVGI